MDGLAPEPCKIQLRNDFNGWVLLCSRWQMENVGSQFLSLRHCYEKSRFSEPSMAPNTDRGMRLLETVKNNCGPPATPIRLQWSNGGLALEGATSPMRKVAQDQQADEVFLTRPHRTADQPMAGYAPTILSPHNAQTRRAGD